MKTTQYVEIEEFTKFNKVIANFREKKRFLRRNSREEKPSITLKLNALECETLFDKAIWSYATKLGVETADYHMGDTETHQALDSYGRDDQPTPNHGEAREAASSPPIIRRKK